MCVYISYAASSWCVCVCGFLSALLVLTGLSRTALVLQHVSVSPDVCVVVGRPMDSGLGALQQFVDERLASGTLAAACVQISHSSVT